MKLIDKIIKLVKDTPPDAISPESLPPFRTDWIKKYELLEKLQKIKEQK